MDNFLLVALPMFIFMGLMLAGIYIVYIFVRAKMNPSLAPPIGEEDRVDLRGKLIALKARVVTFPQIALWLPELNFGK